MKSINKYINKIAIIGKGTAGCMAATFFRTRTSAEIDWYFDPSTPAQSVGEGSTLPFPKSLFTDLNIGYAALESVGGTIKKGIRKIDYAGAGDYLHEFPMGSSAVHFSASQLQGLTEKILTKRGVNIIDKKIESHDDIDADYIIDCSGRPSSFDDCQLAEYTIPNAAYVVQCPWPGPAFDYTMTIARPFGWVFAIPLRDRVSVGYLYNEKLNTKEQIAEDIKEVTKNLHVEPEGFPNSFSFQSYYRKENFSNRVTYNGNASFFLEPLEATSVGFIDEINMWTYKMMNNDLPIVAANAEYTREIKSIEHMIMLHYYAGSNFNTPFWELGKQKGEESTKEMVTNNKFRKILKQAIECYTEPEFGKVLESQEYGQWPAFSYYQNLVGLDILRDVDNLVRNYDNGL
mgnify:CR=1 FL=1